MNIYQKIAEIQKLCSHVTKDTEVGNGNNKYKAVSHDGVLTLVRQPLIDQGIVVAVSQQAKGEHYDGVTQNGNAKMRFEAVYDISFINIDKPEDRMTVSVEAHGEDSNDKGPGKAISYATKTAMLKTFLIVTGENDEKRIDEGVQQQGSEPTTVSATISEPQYKRLFAICKKSGITVATVGVKFGFKEGSEITKSQYKEICEWAEVGHKVDSVNEIMGEPFTQETT